MLESLIQVLGRLHPMVLHMPIGILGGLIACEAFAIARRRRLEASVRRTLACLAAASAAIAAASGLLLSRESTYGGDTLELHQWLGIGTAVGAIITAAFSLRSGALPYRIMLFLTACVMVPAGHFGAEMTHGADFVLAPFRSKPSVDQPRSSAQTVADSVYHTRIASILSTRCVNCHGPSRQKGGLSLDTPQGILAGGENGSVLTPGDAKHSEILIRMRLPLDHDDHMPPKQKGQPTAEEIAAIEEWISQGASFESGETGGKPPQEPHPPVAKPAARALPPPEALARLEAQQVHVEATDPDSGTLWISFAAVPGMTDESAIALLSPLKDFIADLSVARTMTGDATLAVIGGMKNLRRLDLSGTRITPAGLDAITSLSHLEELRITRTKLNATVVPKLQNITSLKRVYVWNADLDAAAIDQLHTARPDLAINAGVEPAEPLLTEPELTFSSEEPLPGAAKTVSLDPVNSVCPVSGSPIDRKYLVVNEGRVVGFCCEKCAAQFLADPAKFAVKPN